MSNLRTYTFGYLLSIILTLAAVWLFRLHEYTGHVFPTHTELRVSFAVLAICQIIIQLLFFLHMGRGQKSEWRAVVLCFALFVVMVIVGGSLWIMQNLQTNMQNTLGTFLNNNVNVQNEND
jgi:cytochrome o ubiquinol oxidase operon protein cyoD